MNPDCYFGDHEWRGGVCVGCGERLRCACGAFASADEEWWTAHVDRCPFVVRSLAMAVNSINGESG